MNEQDLTCPCGYPDYRIEVNFSALIAVDPDEVTLDIEGSSAYPRVGDVFCANCDRRTMAQHLRTGGSPSDHQAAVSRGIAALEGFDAMLDLRGT